MDLHHQAVLACHLSHLVKHVRRECIDVALARFSPAEDACIHLTGRVLLHWGGIGEQMAVIGGTGACLDEGRAAGPRCAPEKLPVLADVRQIVRESVSTGPSSSRGTPRRAGSMPC